MRLSSNFSQQCVVGKFDLDDENIVGYHGLFLRLWDTMVIVD